MAFRLNASGAMEYQGGKEDWERAAEIAASCDQFSEDDENEQVADEGRSCYNCRYRRWTSISFICCQKNAVRDMQKYRR